ncbi:protein TE14 [Testudinid alphaherpesvirus 3]|uniref:Protein TE14 n=1 Tax=Testudinid alphaherpesvirus 3 TaxID=2560801 RepID=A0A0K1R1G4_9ALPH|nr:protein TE14 [Testudinid alphaherpesvirus 3]AIU39325.1 protein TE14 [Testudinid alphaherpesvirus 3]AKV40738.1 hypothetical protein [Testudinid alphaherpesvirus 3]
MAPCVLYESLLPENCDVETVKIWAYNLAVLWSYRGPLGLGCYIQLERRPDGRLVFRVLLHSSFIPPGSEAALVKSVHREFIEDTEVFLPFELEPTCSIHPTRLIPDRFFSVPTAETSHEAGRIWATEQNMAIWWQRVGGGHISIFEVIYHPERRYDVIVPSE